MHPRDTSAASHAAQLAAYRRLGPERRARLAGRLSEDTRALTRAGIRARHPDYTDVDVEHAFRRLLYGDEMFQRVWPGRPLLAP